MTLSGALGAVGVATGAFGAHGLRGHVPPEHLEVWKTAVFYHLLHAVALLAVALLARYRSRWVNRAGWLFGVGVALFSGSLYALVLTGVSALGAVTPFGGVALIAGWVCLALSARGISDDDAGDH